MCDVELGAGELRVKGTFPGLLFFGLSWQHLWWSRPGAGREIVLDSGGACSAGRCPECGLIAFVPPRRR